MAMKYLGAYLMAVLGGKEEPTAKDCLKRVFALRGQAIQHGLEAIASRLEAIVYNFAGTDLIRVAVLLCMSSYPLMRLHSLMWAPDCS